MYSCSRLLNWFRFMPYTSTTTIFIEFHINRGYIVIVMVILIRDLSKRAIHMAAERNIKNNKIINWQRIFGFFPSVHICIGLIWS